MAASTGVTSAAYVAWAWGHCRPPWTLCAGGLPTLRRTCKGIWPMASISSTSHISRGGYWLLSATEEPEHSLSTSDLSAPFSLLFAHHLRFTHLSHALKYEGRVEWAVRARIHEGTTLVLRVSFPSRVPLILANQPCIVDGGGLRRDPSERNCGKFSY